MINSAPQRSASERIASLGSPRIVSEVIREFFHQIRDSGDREPPNQRRPEIVRENPKQRRQIGGVSTLHHLVKGSVITSFEQLLHPGRGVAQPIRREVDGEGVPIRFGRALELFVVNQRIGHSFPRRTNLLQRG